MAEKAQLIEVTNQAVHYGDFAALREVNLMIPKGDITALVGPSGCGMNTSRIL